MVLDEIASVAEENGVELHLETDLKPVDIAAMLKEIGSPLVRANYDTGNSASLGYDPVEELGLLSSYLGSVHIKDRVRGGGTVPLGSGTVDFLICFRLIRTAGFSGPFILQVARGEAGREVELARSNRRFVEVQLASASV